MYVLNKINVLQGQINAIFNLPVAGHQLVQQLYQPVVSVWPKLKGYYKQSENKILDVKKFLQKSIV